MCCVCLCSAEVDATIEDWQEDIEFSFSEIDAYSSRPEGILSRKPKISELDRDWRRRYSTTVLSYIRLAPLLTSLLQLYSSSLTPQV